MIIEFKYPIKRKEFEKYVAENNIEESRIWYDGERVVIKDAEPVAVPESVSPRQIRQALTAAGLRARVETAVSIGDQDLKDWWEFSNVFERAHPMVIGMAGGLGVTKGQLDNLFIIADSL